MYATNHNEKTLILGVSGMLWKRSLVMYDKQTESYWSHILGRCMDGPLKGVSLKQIPAVLTDWQTWSQQNPSGKVLWLSRTSRNYTRDVYRRPQSYVLGIADHETSKAWSFPKLIETRLLHDRWQDRPVLVTWDAESATARLFSPIVDGKQLTFVWEEEKLLDNQTRSSWNPATGVAIAGDYQKSFLKPLPAIVSFREVWQNFYPDSKIK